jgi:hypothetical protein
MSTDRWNRLSDWHSAWLKGDSAERRRLRDELTLKSPDLVAEADAVAAASLSMSGFLETPAFMLTAAQLASDEAAMKPGTLVGPYQIITLIARGGVGGGGDQPVWRRDGTELFFAGPEGRLFAVSVRPGPNAGLSFGTATKLNVPPLGERHQHTLYDVSLDGRIVYFQAQTDQIPPREFGIVLGWRALIK